jgi:hypothetical protein
MVPIVVFGIVHVVFDAIEKDDPRVFVVDFLLFLMLLAAAFCFGLIRGWWRRRRLLRNEASGRDTGI